MSISTPSTGVKTSTMCVGGQRRTNYRATHHLTFCNHPWKAIESIWRCHEHRHAEDIVQQYCAVEDMNGRTKNDQISSMKNRSKAKLKMSIFKTVDAQVLTHAW
jgi:hypothetical protein